MPYYLGPSASFSICFCEIPFVLVSKDLIFCTFAVTEERWLLSNRCLEFEEDFLSLDILFQAIPIILVSIYDKWLQALVARDSLVFTVR